MGPVRFNGSVLTDDIFSFAYYSVEYLTGIGGINLVPTVPMGILGEVCC
jgi:hypothetical protein